MVFHAVLSTLLRRRSNDGRYVCQRRRRHLDFEWLRAALIGAESLPYEVRINTIEQRASSHY